MRPQLRCAHTLFTLAPGQSHNIVATFRPPQGIDASTFPVYSGFIEITSGTEKVHATYLGLAASLRDKQVVDNTDAVFGVELPVILDQDQNVQEGPANYTLVGDDAPLVFWRQAFGTPVFRLDLVSSMINLNGTLNKRGEEGLGISFAQAHKGGSFGRVPIAGALLEVDYLPRNNVVDAPNFSALMSNTFANGSAIPVGSYKILLRALRVTGDPTNIWE
ncbi:hypothetical protein C8J57DRAFT_1230964 [Mycena rebaudengoi]|nr:hypothetical protein C8J57DRAFT_1230964 [Mycena rebaudengoi]